MLEVCFSPVHLDYHDRVAVRTAADRIQQLGMEAYSFHAPFAEGLDISALEPAARQKALDEILRAADAAAILRVHYFVIHPGPESVSSPPREECLQRMENMAQTLDSVAAHCARLGIRCVLENKLPHLLFGRTSDILWILDALESTDVGVCLDTGHASLSRDLLPLVHKISGHLKMIHAHDNLGNRDDHLPPGDGRILWEPLLRALDAASFSGAIILELAAASTVTETMANAVRGRAYLREVSRRVSLALPGEGPTCYT